MLSMPPGTPPKGVLEAARELRTRGICLEASLCARPHTDEPHPHVHLVVKAVSEQGVRLNIRKATLREWRQEFARHLRIQGIAAQRYRARRSRRNPNAADRPNLPREPAR